MVIPQRRYLPRNASLPTPYRDKNSVQFKANGHVEGFPLHLAFNHSFESLADSNLSVLEDVESVSASLRLEWPGYLGWRHHFDTKNWKTDRGPFMRRKLAHKLATMIHTFFQECKVDEQSSAEDVIWRLGGGPNEIKFEDVLLVALHNVSAGSWQPELRLLRH
ncbi:hypothetical protein BJ138DRAFT_1159676 [Hygrophoropsis aurantiaca]|uniref:Uncharacterized protein n=1 Tax=Hygrophoropsis aurantiaca TaxID=72124 RepID=A0ACB8A4E7_9AGAM|nr:hypothetical protein BJ138DRAFT_1159676 [Hygrophoropsis aurantiaca]